MAANEAELYGVGKRDFFTSNRVLGTLGIIGAPMLAVNLVLSSAFENRFAHFFGVFYIAGWICSTIGMRRRRATGNGAASAILFGAQIIGLVLALLNSAQDAFGVTAETTGLFYGICDAAYPLSHLLMLIVAAFVWRTGVWTNWRKFAPLVCGLALPSFFVSAAIGNSILGAAIFGFSTAAGFAMLGLAVRTESK